MDLLFDAVSAFPAVLEASEMPIRILALHGAQRWRDPSFLPFDDAVALCFDSAVGGAAQEAVAVSPPGSPPIVGPVDLRTFLRRPLLLALLPHRACLRCVLVPLIRSGLLLCRDPLRPDGPLLGKSPLQLDVMLLSSARLG